MLEPEAIRLVFLCCAHRKQSKCTFFRIAHDPLGQAFKGVSQIVDCVADQAVAVYGEPTHAIVDGHELQGARRGVLSKLCARRKSADRATWKAAVDGLNSTPNPNAKLSTLKGRRFGQCPVTFDVWHITKKQRKRSKGASGRGKITQWHTLVATTV